MLYIPSSYREFTAYASRCESGILAPAADERSVRGLMMMKGLLAHPTGLEHWTRHWSVSLTIARRPPVGSCCSPMSVCELEVIKVVGICFYGNHITACFHDSLPFDCFSGDGQMHLSTASCSPTPFLPLCCTLLERVCTLYYAVISPSHLLVYIYLYLTGSQ